MAVYQMVFGADSISCCLNVSAAEGETIRKQLGTTGKQLANN